MHKIDTLNTSKEYFYSNCLCMVLWLSRRSSCWRHRTPPPPPPPTASSRRADVGADAGCTTRSRRHITFVAWLLQIQFWSILPACVRRMNKGAHGIHALLYSPSAKTAQRYNNAPASHVITVKRCMHFVSRSHRTAHFLSAATHLQCNVECSIRYVRVSVCLFVSHMPAEYRQMGH